jgi:acetylornithine deacetylase/succinyl-diaminopimelate desuccinylase-like protein
VSADSLLNELEDWLRIPSISSGGGDPADLLRAAEWARDYMTGAGGGARIVTTEVNPLVEGELKSADPDAPTVLIYGHYDVQSPEPTALWTTPPFDPQVRNGRIYARGAADDKGNFFPLLHVACRMAKDGSLPVHVRVLLDGEEEIGGDSAPKWVAADERGADAALVFDGEMLDERTPAITTAVRGLVAADVTIRTSRADLHSGLYGGTVLNAVHVLQVMLAEVLPDSRGLLRDELRAGIEAPADAERASWAELPPAAELFEQIDGRPIHPESAASYYERNWADASLDVNGIAGGDAIQKRTIIPATATAKVTQRLAPGQRCDDIGPVLKRLLEEAAPSGAEVEMKIDGCDPASFDPNSPALTLAASALEEACGVPPALLRSGGSIPVLSAFAARGIPTILSGFALPDDAFHAPDESFRLESLRMSEASTRAIYAHLAKLPRP